MEGNGIPVEFPVKNQPKLSLAVNNLSSSYFSRWFQVQASDFLLDDSAIAESSDNIESSDKTGQYGANISIQTLLWP